MQHYFESLKMYVCVLIRPGQFSRYSLLARLDRTHVQGLWLEYPEPQSFHDGDWVLVEYNYNDSSISLISGIIYG